MAKRFFFIAFAAAALSLQAQPIRVEMSLSSDSMFIGDQVEMTLRIAHLPDIAFSFPEIGDTLMPKIEVLRQSKLDTLPRKKTDTMVTLERRYTLTCFDAGIIYTLPQFQFIVDSNIIESNQVTLKVMFPPMDSTWRLNDDIKPPIEYPITFAEALPYVLGGLLIVALIAFLFYYLDRRRKNQPIFFRPKPKEPAHILALRGLQKLKEEQLWQHGKIKDFHTRISEILRTYIEDRFCISAMEQTSDEILSAFEANNVCNKKNMDALREIFAISDLVKFAKYPATPDENETSFVYAKNFVEQTKIEAQQNATTSTSITTSTSTSTFPSTTPTPAQQP
jgi:hypothetical protein